MKRPVTRSPIVRNSRRFQFGAERGADGSPKVRCIQFFGSIFATTAKNGAVIDVLND